MVYGLPMTNMAAATIDTSGQVLITIPNGSSIVAGQGIFLALHILDGMDPNASISAIVADWSTSSLLMGNFDWDIWVQDHPWGTVTWNNLGLTPAAGGGKIQYDISGAGHQALCVYVQAINTVASTTYDNFLQIRNLGIFVDDMPSPEPPTIDSAVHDIVAECLPSAVVTPTTQTIGTPLSQLMIDPHTTAADAISTDILPRAAFPPQCGIAQGNLVCVNRPATPPDPRRLWQVSEANTPGLQWDVAVDDEQRVDYVAADYNILGVNSCLYPENDDLTVWPNLAGGWDFIDATHTSIYNSASSYWFHIVGDSTNYNPIVTYPQGGYLPATPGLAYRLSGLVYTSTYVSGTTHVGVQ
jgi:hypothetical protein